MTCEVAADETFGALRARLSKELGIADGRGFLMHHGEAVRTNERTSVACVLVCNDLRHRCELRTPDRPCRDEEVAD